MQRYGLAMDPHEWHNDYLWDPKSRIKESPMSSDSGKGFDTVLLLIFIAKYLNLIIRGQPDYANSQRCLRWG